MGGNSGSRKASARKKSSQHREKHEENRKDSPKANSQHDLSSQQDDAESVDEPDPAYLRSIDYHNFLHGSSKAESKVTQSPTVMSTFSAPLVTPKKFTADSALDDFSASRTAFTVKASKEKNGRYEQDEICSPLPMLSKKTSSRYLSKKDSTETL
ncbi:hypothetical protein SLS53_006089 [Cytospora paraplurivora]|uniref:Uncharacterized protein n=1 Tax=Cytospora paraplurivora TaxID=2898453 RepID=A0AAN9YFL3_9PEZI